MDGLRVSDRLNGDGTITLIMEWRKDENNEDWNIRVEFKLTQDQSLLEMLQPLARILKGARELDKQPTVVARWFSVA